MTPNQFITLIKDMRGSAYDNFTDVRADPIFNDIDVMDEARVIATLDYIIDHADDFKAYVE